MEEIIENYFDIFTTLAEDFIASHSLNQSPHIPRADDLILNTQLSLKTSCYVVKKLTKNDEGR